MHNLKLRNDFIKHCPKQ